MRRESVGLLTVVALSLAHPSHAADSGPGVKLSDFLSGSGFQVKFGYQNDFVAKKSRTYYDFSIKGKDLFSHGSPVDPTDLGIEDDPINFGDAPLTLSIQNGQSQIGGKLLSSIGVAPISFPNGLGKNIRFLAGYDAQLETGKQSTGFAGLEWKPFDATQTQPGDGKSSNAGFEHFFGVSVRYERHSTTSDAIEETSTAAIRARVGIGLFPVVSHQRVQESIADFKKALMNASGPVIDRRGGSVRSLDATEKSAALVHVLKNKRGINLDAIGQYMRSNGPSRISALGVVRESSATVVSKMLMSADRADLHLLEDAIKATSDKNNPSLSLFAEFDGSMNLGNQGSGKKSRDIYSLNARYSLNPNDENSAYIWARFENGFSRAEPDKRVSTFMIMGVIKF